MSHDNWNTVHPMLVQWWPIVYDAGPTLYQHWVNVSCLLGNSPHNSARKQLGLKYSLYNLSAIYYYIADELYRLYNITL